MSETIEHTYFILNNYKQNTDEILKCEKKLIDEYNNITEDYRILFNKIKIQIKKNKDQIITKCDHNYIRYSEYHNDRYFICNKCGHEKY